MLRKLQPPTGVAGAALMDDGHAPEWHRIKMPGRGVEFAVFANWE
jgi:hypothetical protein